MYIISTIMCPIDLETLIDKPSSEMKCKYITDIYINIYTDSVD